MYNNNNSNNNNNKTKNENKNFVHKSLKEKKKNNKKIKPNYRVLYCVCGYNDNGIRNSISHWHQQ